MLFYGSIGVCIAAIPLALLLVLQCSSNVGLKQQILYYKEWEKKGMYLHVWILNKDISAENKVTRSYLEKKKIWISESDNMNIITDIHQIIGKRTKTALKKGTLMKSDLLFQKNKQKNTKKKT